MVRLLSSLLHVVAIAVAVVVVVVVVVAVAISSQPRGGITALAPTCCAADVLLMTGDTVSWHKRDIADRSNSSNNHDRSVIKYKTSRTAAIAKAENNNTGSISKTARTAETA